MRNSADETVIAIDRGASFTDFGIVGRSGLEETFSLEKRDWKSIAGVFENLSATYHTSHAVFSGCAAGMPDDLRARTSVIAEIDAIGFGGAALADCNDCGRCEQACGCQVAIRHWLDKARRLAALSHKTGWRSRDRRQPDSQRDQPHS